MKTFVTIICILLATTLFLSPFTTARELAEITPGKASSDGIIPDPDGKPYKPYKPPPPKYPPKKKPPPYKPPKKKKPCYKYKPHCDENETSP